MNKTERVMALIGFIRLLIPILVSLISMFGVIGCSQHAVYHKDYYKEWTHEEFMELRSYANNMHFPSELADSDITDSELVALVEALKLMMSAKTGDEDNVASIARKEALESVLAHLESGDKRSKYLRRHICFYAEYYTPFKLLRLEASIKLAINFRR